jgi:hypothetical protein
MRTDSSPMRTDSSPMRTDSSPMRTDSSPMRTDSSLMRTDSSLMRTDIILTNENGGLINRCNFYEMRQEDLDLKHKEDLDLKYEYATVKYHNIQNIITSSNLGIESIINYKSNPYGVFNIVGNVSEMIQEEDIAMGGDWMSTGYNVRITSKKQYNNSDATVDFRVYMEIIEF